MTIPSGAYSKRKRLLTTSRNVEFLDEKLHETEESVNEGATLLKSTIDGR